MINPIHFYKCYGRPLGIWLALFVMIAEAIEHVRAALAGNMWQARMFVAVPVFALSVFFLIRRRLTGMWLSIAFLILSMYAALAFAIEHPREGPLYVICWWLASLAGIFALLSNRRWYDERMINFPLS